MNWVGLTPEPDKYHGFVYKITNLTNGRYYYGRKYYWHTKMLSPLKGKSRRRKKVVESDWKSYYGSSSALLEDVNALGKESFTREIIFQGARGEVNYKESYYQFNHNVLLDPASYNEQIHIRIHSSALKGLTKEK